MVQASNGVCWFKRTGRMVDLEYGSSCEGDACSYCMVMFTVVYNGYVHSAETVSGGNFSK